MHHYCNSVKGQGTDHGIRSSEDGHLKDKTAALLAYPVHAVSRCGDPKDTPGPGTAIIHFRDDKGDPQPH
jgi:hypothetical protein